MTEINPQVRLDRDGAVAVLIIDSPPVNALDQRVRDGLQRGLQTVGADRSIAAVIIACAGRTFIAGADLTEFDRPPEAPTLHDVIAELERSAKPTVAAIHGFCLGGGLEIALGCHFRVASADARLGLPEVKLGLLPGAGGTQRLPRLIGVERALDMIVSGEQVDSATALASGLLDKVAPGDVRAAAIEYVREVVAERRVYVRVSARDEKLAEARQRPDTLAAFAATNAKRFHGFKAPAACIDAVRAAIDLPFEQGLAREDALFRELVSGDQSRAQRHLFFAEREAARVPDVPKDTPVRKIASAAIIGAGTMGSGIAMCFADAGIAVIMIDVDPAALQRGLAHVANTYQHAAARGRMTGSTAAARTALIRGGTNYHEIGQADIVIEAVFEDMGLKQQVFAQMEANAKPGAILATNTSTLDLDAIAGSTRAPDRVIGTHFFSPANIMKLLEVVRGAKTSKSTIAGAMALAKRLRKVPVLVGVCDGFVGNRMLAQRENEAERLLIEGALPQEVDQAMLDFGFAMGPFAVGDLSGLDVGYRIRRPRGVRHAVADALCEAGRIGQKSGAGYFAYAPGDRRPQPDPAVEKIILDASVKEGVVRRRIAPAEIVERLIYPMVNEGAKILEEGVAIRPSDIDVVWAYGYGWPAYRGGPMFYADQVGLGRIRDWLDDLAGRRGAADLRPAGLLRRMVDSGSSFIRHRGHAPA